MSDEVVVGDLKSTERGSGARKNKGKAPVSLLPLVLLMGVVRVLEFGANKYAPYNWSKGMQWSVCMDCALRHLIKWWWCGEENDEETGESHLDHAIANLIFLRHYVSTYKEGDDRPPAYSQLATHIVEVRGRG